MQVSLRSRDDATVRGVPVIKPETAAAMRKMLEMAAGPKGTAPLARVPGYRVGGKTGTTTKLENGRYVKKYVASFVGMAPITQPRIIVAVMVDEPNAGKWYGGDVAAPVFSQVVQQTLRMMGVPPDLEVKPQIVTKDIPAEEESF